MRRKSIFRRNQRGVALLFALGVLSLLLVMGLAFVANSLLAQKVASNNSSRSQAKMLALSAVSRMAMSVMYYQYNASNPPAGASYSRFIPENYMDVRSYYNLIKTGSEPDHSDDAATDGLRNADSKLIPGIWLTNYDLASDLRGEWSYITAKDADDKDKLVGRIAYQLIPTTTSAQINLDHSLRGVYPQGTPARIPWNVRIGEDINELNLNQTYVLKNWQTEAPDENEMHASTFDAFFQAYAGSIFSADKDVKETWLKHWFIDGIVAADPEYYRYDKTTGTKTEISYYHRFNLGELKESASAHEWYPRFVKEGSSDIEKNSKAAVDALAGDSVEFEITDSATPRGSVGLPFLKFIGSSAGSFENIEFRRKQIAANLNDYCDGDSIPTSDVDAKTWQNKLAADSNIDSDWPKYTGNEKTPYINEFAFGFQVEPSIENPNSSTMKIKADVTAELVAELISIYELKPEDEYKLYMGLPADQFTFTLDIEAQIKVNTENISPNPKRSITFTFASGAPDIREISFAKELWKEGYALNHLELPLEATGGNVLDCSTEISNKLNGTPGTVELTGVSFKISNFKFQPRGLALTRSEGGTEYGVDFVRWKDSVTAPDKELFTKDANYNAGSLTITGGSFSVSEETSKKIFLAGMQARDPRQNLNVSNAAAADENQSDWRKFEDIQWVEYDKNLTNPSGNKYDDNKLAMKVNFAADTLAEAFTLTSDSGFGLVNGLSNPSAQEKDSANTVVGDKEFVTDPAWRTESGHETGDPKTELHLSTAYIRNAPMRSPWELGVIHRAMAWQTLNLKSARKPVSTSDTATEAEVPDDDEPISSEDMNPDLSWDEATGTSFAGGDGGLLEQIKMTDNAYCYGKLNVNMLSNNTTLNPDYTDKDDDMARALFFNLRRGQSVGDLFVDDSGSYPETGTLIDWDATTTVAEPMKEAVDKFRAEYGEDYKNAFENRAQFLAWNANLKSPDEPANYQPCLANGFGIISQDKYKDLPDAQREEIVGKTINLIKGTNSVSNMIRFVVVAQTIRDMKGPIARIKYDGSVKPRDCEYGVFDIEPDDSAGELPENERFLYFDEITGEVKLLVTMENNPTTGQIIVRQIEYIE